MCACMRRGKRCFAAALCPMSDGRGADDFSLAAQLRCSRGRRALFPMRSIRSRAQRCSPKGEVPVFAQNASILSYAACLGVGLPKTEGEE